MCGICGVYYINKNISKNLLVRMCNSLYHRGPDDSGCWISKNSKVGFGHRRLSILDLSKKGHQPMFNYDKSIVIVFNGEIYNYKKIKKWLLSKGYKFKSNTDTECLIYLYEKIGIKFVDKLEGDFAIGLYDQNSGRLFLIRDRIGVKPLYYYKDETKLVFASEIKSILCDDNINRDINEEALYHYLTLLSVPSPMTLFKNINTIPAGHYGVFCGGKFELVKYWDVNIDIKMDLTEDVCIKEANRFFNQAVEKRLQSDVPVGVFLSGGVDSSSIVALITRYSNEKIKTFTVGFDTENYKNETENAKSIAKDFKTEHHEIIINQKDFMSSLPNIIYHQDQPIADPVCIPLYFVSKLLKENNVTVVLVGEGSDELFAGYDYYIQVLNRYNFIKSLYKLPKFIRQWIYFISKILPSKYNHLHDVVYRIYNNYDLLLGSIVAFTQEEKSNLLNPVFRDKMKKYNTYSFLTNFTKRFDGNSDPLNKLLYVDFKHRLAELLLMRVDKMTMATSVEARVPFLDHKLIEFVMSVPNNIKIKNNNPKYLVKKFMKNQLSEDVLMRKKQGFGTPLSGWLKGELGDKLENILFNSSIREKNYFNYGFIKDLIAIHKKGKRDYSLQLWTLLNLSLWYDFWIKREDIKKKHSL